jgi:regulator of sigma E protease
MLTLYTIVVILLMFGATIFVHELGHFLVARRCGMVVEVFSIGFGPAIWKTKRNGITYKIGIFPFGG